MAKWREYQENAASFFRSLGFHADTDVTIAGSRTVHDVDVLVKSKHAGFDVTWVVECKLWKTPITKLHVIALRQIVIDAGADRGILLSESGFQDGAREAATLTNIQLLSLADLRIVATNAVHALRFRELLDRLLECKDRYWSIPKDDRIAHGLRHDVGDYGYSGRAVIDACEDAIRRAMRGNYPFQAGDVQAFLLSGINLEFFSPVQVVEFVAPLVDELEHKLDAYDRSRRVG